ncbi:MAG: low molecular weight phosphatase family protein [Chloroflexota bacterium]
MAVDPTVVEARREVGIDMSGNIRKALTLEVIEHADKMVTMGCGVEGVCPMSVVKTQDWGLEDPKGEPLGKVREIRDETRSAVLKMLDELEA